MSLTAYSTAGHWFKGNVHTHTTQSDGRRTPAEAVAFYREHGYDFVALSDHWVLTPGGLHDEERTITLAAAEVQGSGYHLLTLGAHTLPPIEWEEQPQRILDYLKPQGALCYIAHPYWTGRPSTEIAALEGLDGVEAYNGVCEGTRGTGHARVHWDDCLSAGRRLNGLAVDDSHWHGTLEGDGFIVVHAPELTEAAILQAMAEGAYYSSTGPVIEDLRLATAADGTLELCVRCSPCDEIVFYTCGPRGARFVAPQDGKLDSARLRLSADQVFVRVECREGVHGCAWSNPVYVADVL